MCLIAWNWRSGSQHHLMIAANRDEFYARATKPLHWWEDGKVLAGQDLSAGGTWLGVTRDGRMAALTNFRDPRSTLKKSASRGKLVANFLLGNLAASDYLDEVLPELGRYNPFNLLVWDGTQLMGLESRHARAFAMAPGVGAVSNADFFTAWPKVEGLRTGMTRLEDLPRASQEPALWKMLSDVHIAPDDLLPETGITLERERALSAAFIRTKDYGTRSSTLLSIGPGGIWMEERVFDHDGPTARSQFTA